MLCRIANNFRRRVWDVLTEVSEPPSIITTTTAKTITVPSPSSSSSSSPTALYHHHHHHHDHHHRHHHHHYHHRHRHCHHRHHHHPPPCTIQRLHQPPCCCCRSIAQMIAAVSLVSKAPRWQYRRRASAVVRTTGSSEPEEKQIVRLESGVQQVHRDYQGLVLRPLWALNIVSKANSSEAQSRNARRFGTLNPKPKTLLILEFWLRFSKTLAALRPPRNAP